MYSNLRFVASASLVALASLVGVLALFPDALEELVLASAETSDSPATACKQDWLRFDPSCSSRRGMPWVAPFPNSNATPSTGEDASARLGVAAAAPEPGRQDRPALRVLVHADAPGEGCVPSSTVEPPDQAEHELVPPVRADQPECL